MMKQCHVAIIAHYHDSRHNYRCHGILLACEIGGHTMEHPKAVMTTANPGGLTL